MEVFEEFLGDTYGILWYIKEDVIKIALIMGVLNQPTDDILAEKP